MYSLNPNQQNAVLSKNKKILVMAGAGSGKTKVLTTRIKHLLDIGTNPKDICAFTFTNKAAREMKWRLESLIRKDTISQEIELPIISTFHSYCYSYLCYFDFFQKLGFTKRPDIIEESLKSQIIKNILSAYKEDYSNIPFVKAISQIKNKAKITDIDSKDLQIINTVYNEYQQKLKISNMIDFDDMIPLFLELCKENDFKEIVQTKYLLIDESQDTNQIQYELIKTISSYYGNIFMVGDEDQVIYSFRNSDISILKDFEQNADEVIILNQNYRCNQEILNHANKLIDYNPNRLKKELFSNIKTLQNVEYHEFSTSSEEAMMVANKIKEQIQKGIKPSEIAVLYRNNNQAFLIEKELKSKNIPYTQYGGKPFFEYKEIRTIINTYRLLFNPRNEIAFENMYNQTHPIEAYEYKAFIDDYHEQKVFDIIRYASGYGLNKKFQDLGYNLLALQDMLNNNTQLDIYMQMLELLHYNKYLKQSNHQKPQYTRIMALKDMIKDLNNKQLEEAFNQMLLDNVSTNPNNAVSLLTIHKAKGLEFEVVFLIGFNEGITPNYNKQNQELEEERRIAYVAITRAKQQLYLYCSNIHFINGNMAKMKPSSFLVEAGIQEAKSMDFFGNYCYNH